MATATFKIERNVPVPRKPYRYPFSEMQIGDSFTVHVGENDTAYTVANRLRSSAHWYIQTYAARNFGYEKKIVVSIDRHSDAAKRSRKKECVRIWRTE
ncbi:MAG TPA: hypothetical protein VNQ76_18495 [Planctomicrobium sp.]|nr:hypothetical protein [Planctomicrobium sp.]